MGYSNYRLQVLVLLLLLTPWQTAWPLQFAPGADASTNEENTPLYLSRMQATDTTLALSIAIPAAEYFVGDEIPVVFTVTNTGANPFSYFDRNGDRSGRMSEYQVIVYDASGIELPDPCADFIGISGGISTIATLEPGDSLEATATLNRWALPLEAGEYTVIGKYNSQLGATWSEAVVVNITPRSDADMDAYIEKLEEELAKAESDETREALIKKLMYTGDPCAAPILAEMLYLDWDVGFWAHEAFYHYLPRDRFVKQAVFEAVSKRGFGYASYRVARELELPDEQMKSLIEVSLDESRPESWMDGAGGAIQYPDDRFMDRLIAIASTPSAEGRSSAIHALARNRTDASVKTLHNLLKDQTHIDDQGKYTVASIAEQSIRNAYNPWQPVTGRPLKPEDFPAKYHEPMPNSYLE